MNFITHERAYCLYPRETLVKKTVLLLGTYMFLFEDLVSKYTPRGFTFHAIAYGAEFGIRHARWVEDARSFVVPLNPHRIYYPGGNLVDPIRLTSWSIRSTRDKHYSPFFRIVPYWLDTYIGLLTVGSMKMEKLVLSCANLDGPERKEFAPLFPGDGSES